MVDKDFLNSLDKGQLRNELILCHKHFRACLSALEGNMHVRAVDLADISDCADLELFYKCRSAGKELKMRRRSR